MVPITYRNLVGMIKDNISYLLWMCDIIYESQILKIHHKMS